MTEVNNIARNSENISDQRMTYLKEKINKIKNSEAYIELGKLRGSMPKRNLSDEEIHKIREKAFNSLLKKKGLKLADL